MIPQPYMILERLGINVQEDFLGMYLMTPREASQRDAKFGMRYVSLPIEDSAQYDPEPSTLGKANALHELLDEHFVVKAFAVGACAKHHRLVGQPTVFVEDHD